MYMHGGSPHAGEPGSVLYVEARVLLYTATEGSECAIIENFVRDMEKKVIIRDFMMD